MEEFTSIAIWLLMAFLIINTAIFWFDTQPEMVDNGLGVGVTENTAFTEDDLANTNSSFFGISCNQASTNILLFGPCFLQQVLDLLYKFLDNLWSFLTAWANLLNVLLADVPGGDLFRMILIPFFGIIEFMAIFVIGLKVAGIVRGGS